MSNKVAYMNLNRIEFIVTWQCGGKCKHCQIGGEINKSGPCRHVRPDYAAEAIQKLSSIFPITSVMTFGGEPLYYPEAVCAIHQKAADCGIGTRQLLTNGYFTNNAETSRRVAHALAESGVNSLLLSVDAFHQEHIPLEPVYRFARYIAEAKIPGAYLYPAWLVHEDHDNPYNAGTKEILARFSDVSIPIQRGNNIFLSGYASRHLSEYYPQHTLDLTANCASIPYAEPLTSVTSLSIVPNGDVMVCGFVIGNIYIEDILDIVKRYDPHKDERMSAVVDGGVTALLDYAAKKGVEVDLSACGSACDVCHALIKQL